ncbi:LytR/AlgR family response regulator transcription factor [Sporosarcina siberiensis]|uniref:LytR/AlgR family response regulator transcription factor n=1 Tax=Sporosarcina siberiensis TaxID=1365606 RepID=A0ABW4SBP2_9BACL
MENKELNQIKTILEDWIPKDASIAIAVKGRYIHYSAGIPNIHLSKGETVKEGSIAEMTFKKNCKVDALVDDSVFGVSYYGIGYPIHVKDEPGVLVVILPPSHFLKNEPLHLLTGKHEETWCPVPLEHISHIESLQKKTWFYAANKTYSAIHTLKNLETRLPNSFLRIHRSYIVHIPFIQCISRDFSSGLVIKLKDGTELPVSQTYVNHVRKRLEF